MVYKFLNLFKDNSVEKCYKIFLFNFLLILLNSNCLAFQNQNQPENKTQKTKKSLEVDQDFF